MKSKAFNFTISKYVTLLNFSKKLYIYIYTIFDNVSKYNDHSMIYSINARKELNYFKILDIYISNLGIYFQIFFNSIQKKNLQNLKIDHIIPIFIIIFKYSSFSLIEIS